MYIGNASTLKANFNLVALVNMKEVIFFFAVVFYMQAVNAQAGISLDVNPGGIGAYGTVNFTNSTNIGAKPAEAIDYSDIEGSPYFDNKWCRAVLILKNHAAVKANKVKLNLYNGEVHYIDSTGSELFATAGAIKKIFFIDAKDTNKVIAVFQEITNPDSKLQSNFIQVLNQGKTGLLKLTEISTVKKKFDALAGKDLYGFEPKVVYYILNNGVVTPIKSLDKESVLAIVAPVAETEGWLKDHKNKLKNETEIVNYFIYYNTAN